MATTNIDAEWLHRLCDVAIREITKQRKKKSDDYFNEIIKRWKWFRFVEGPRGEGLPEGLYTHIYSSKIGLYPEQALVHLKNIALVAKEDIKQVVTINENEATLIRYLEKRNYNWL